MGILTNVIELAYMLRQVDRHGRALLAGQSPWSIRQTAVYCQFISTGRSRDLTRKPKLTFMLIAPSKSAKKQVSSLLEYEITNEYAILPSKIHLLLVADSLKGWTDYMAWLETQLKVLVRTYRSNDTLCQMFCNFLETKNGWTQY